MKFFKYYLLLIFLFTCSDAKLLHVNESTTNISLMPYVTYYMDHGKKYNIDNIKSIDENKFQHTKKTIISGAFNNDLAIWTKVELANKSDEAQTKYIEFFPTIVRDYSLYDCTFICKKIAETEKGYFIDPVFEITLNPNQIHTFYMYAASNGTAVKTRLTLKNKEEAYGHMREAYFVYAIFFGAMGVLFFYNLFLYFFSRENSYIYYSLYLLSITFHQLLFAGLGPMVLGDEGMAFIRETSVLYPVSFVFFMALFTDSFFNFKENYPKLHKSVLVYIGFLVTIVVLCLWDNSWLNFTLNYGVIGFVGILFVTYYLLFTGNILARFFVAGWTLVVFSIFIMNLQNTGSYDAFEKFPYIVEFGVLVEAILFSLALAYKLKIYREEKEKADKLLLEQQKSETQRLEKVVEERTKKLVEALGERELLMKELNHRVKNNMQLIVSLLRLQANSEKDKKLIDSLQVAEHRIQAMSHLHELLYAQETLTHVNINEYITNMSNELSKNFDPTKDINIFLHVKGELALKQAVYVGLILNEILTNAYKYAFEDKGEIEINFTCKEGKAVLHVKDNGKGFDKENINPNSLGMSVIQTLIQKQLEGSYELNSDVGTQWIVEFDI